MDFTRFADIPVVDGHAHFSHPARMDDILAIMDTVPMARANLVSTPDLQSVNHNAAQIYFKAQHPDRVYISGALDYAQLFAGRDGAYEGVPDCASDILAAQVFALKAIGFDGLKLIEGKPTVRKRIPISLDAPEYEGMWTALEELSMPVVFHVADPEEFWDEERCPVWAREHGWLYSDGTFPSKEALYTETDRVLERHPGLKIVFAHFYFLSADLERAGDFMDAHPNVCFDLTPGVEMYNNFTRTHKVSREFFAQYQDRLIYGTDISSRALQNGEQGMARSLNIAWLVRAFLETDGMFPAPKGSEGWLDPDLDGYCGLALPPEVLHKIYHANFERMYSSAPVPLDREAALAELERIASEVDGILSSDALTGSEAVHNQARQVAGWLAKAWTIE